jgi:essential nuclear protein 1
MPKQKRSDKLKNKGDKRHKGENLEVILREDLAQQSGVVQPRAPRAPKQRTRADSADEELDEAEQAKVDVIARAQASDEARREADERAASMRADDDSDQDESDDDLGLDDDGEDVDNELDLGAEALSSSQMSLVDSFLNPGGRTRTLADMIMEKIAEKERGAMDESDDEDALPEKVVEAYTGMVPLLQRYRCGKLPKAFKVIPALERWEEILWLTRPDEWSPHCCHAATRVFASNLDPKRARTFYGDVLLERCRDDIREHRRLNYHLYQALHRALFKPAPWFKGILLPLVKSGDCTLREALVFGSVLAKASVPAAHAAVVIMKLAELPYSGAQSVFLIVLLNKRYALPNRVIGAVALAFLKHADDTSERPVLWHQSLLVFVQRYRGDLSDDLSGQILKLLKTHRHHTITHDIRRELTAGHRQRAAAAAARS